MKECNKCKIKINTTHEHCPLCHQTLIGENDPNHVDFYPPKEPQHENLPKRTQRFFVFISLLAIVVLGIINFFVREPGFWSLIPIGSIIYFWLIIRFTIFTSVNSMKRITLNSIMLSFMIIFINYFTNREDLWSINYVVPAIIMTNNFIIMLIMFILNKPFRYYAFKLFQLILLSLIPLILYFFGIAEEYMMALFTLAHGLLILIFMIVFYPKILKELLKKIFHI